jgi:hypothetical protein
MVLRWFDAALADLRDVNLYDGSKPPKLGTYSPPPYRVVKRHKNDT